MRRAPLPCRLIVGLIVAALGAPMAAQAQSLWRPDPPPGARSATRLDVARALEAQIEAGLETGAVDTEVADFYRDRNFRPLWAPGRLRLDVDRLAEALGVEIEAEVRDPWRLAEIELALSQAYARGAGQVSELGDEADGVALAYVDPGLRQPQESGGRARLEAAAEAPTVGHLLAEQRRSDPRGGPRNRYHEDLARALEQYRAQWAGLPEVRIAPGRDLTPGTKGARVDQLRARLGLPETGEPHDGLLVEAVSAFQRAHGLEPTGAADAATIRALNAGPAHYERLIEINLERAKALPASFGDRYLLVDAAAGELWFHEHGEVALNMKVVVGKPDQPTPMMAGMVRHLIFNPYWNVPEDLVRTSIAPKVLARGLSYVEDEGLEVLADYTDDAPVLNPAKVDWKAVAAGTLSVRVRQKPGPKNMMGKVKLMLPNPLGIYLHDTPHKGDFARSQRLASSGCVRLEDAMRLAKLLVDEDRAEAALAVGGEERQIDLEAPVPVYITYFTAMPTETGLVFRPDVYGRDAAFAARRAQAEAAPAAD
jgi:murein L,D-transpeptidase YcbB/YkuD